MRILLLFFPVTTASENYNFYVSFSRNLFARINFMILHYIKFTFISKCHTFLLHSSQSHYYRFVCIHFDSLFFILCTFNSLKITDSSILSCMKLRFFLKNQTNFNLIKMNGEIKEKNCTSVLLLIQ